MSEFPEQIATMLDASVASLTLGTNLFVGPMREVSEGMPILAVFVFPVGGGPTLRWCEGAETKVLQPDAQIRVRSAPDKYADGLALARECRDALDYTLNAGEYISILVNDSEPAGFAQQETGAWLFSLTVRGQREVVI